MTSLKTLFKLSLASSAVALPSNKPTHPSKGNIDWSTCNETELTAWGASIAADCGNLEVPLDYSNDSSTEKLTLELLRVPAAVQPSKGSILFNLGGPGEPGRSGLASLDTVLRNLTGGSHDLVVFDPRGTANTIPFFCGSTDLEAQQFLNSMSQTPNASDTQLARSWANAQVNAEFCVAQNNETASLMGTAFTARDLMSVVDALGEDGLLRYWGLSYGTTLGATVAAMFPERIDKMLLDGVQNPHEYYHALADFEEWEQADKSLSALFSFCVEAGPEACQLASFNMTASQLEEAYFALLDAAKVRPFAAGEYVIGYSEIKVFVSSLMYNNRDWPGFAAILAAVFSKPENAAEIFAKMYPSDESESSSIEPGSLLTSTQTASAILGIHCGDRTARTNNFDEFVPAYDKLNNISRVYGEVVAQREMTCAQWPVQTKERYEGDFKVHTPNPVLFVGNDGDALTPLASAYNVSSGFEGSVVLELTDAYGHASVSVPSSCALKHISQYWLDGTLPEKGTKCEVEGKPFSGVTWDDILTQKL
ncbi:hypothetical protein Q7P37_008345 [Cladosporium fusiforme]